MAKSTVYPYGTNGELPSSIGLVDDLKTGGVDKALTAEQGKIIGEKIGFSASGSAAYIPKRCVNALSTDENFGGLITISDNADYCATDYEDVQLYDYAVLHVISGSARGAVRGYAGYVFYDADKNPISGAVTVTGTASAAAYITVEIPTDAVYLRYSLWTGTAQATFYKRAEFSSRDELNESIAAQNAAMDSLADDLGQTYVDDSAEVTQRYVDAVPTSETYGQLVRAGTSSYSATGFIDVADYDYCNLSVVAGSNQNVRDNGGYVFYDENKSPIYGKVTATLPQSATERIVIDIPPAAKYLRYTIWAGTSARGQFYTYKSTNGRVGLLQSYHLQKTSIQKNNGDGVYTYFGSPVQLGHKMRVKRVFQVSYGGLEGCAVFGDYVFGFSVSSRKYFLSDKANPSQSGILPTLASWSQSDILGHDDSSIHENTASFTNLYYDANDELPLILTSGQMGGDYVRDSHVFRCYNDETNGWTLQLLYTITHTSDVGWQLTCLPDGTLFEVNAVPFKKLSAKVEVRTEDVQLTKNDIASILTAGETYTVVQGAAAYDHYLFVAQGYGNSSNPGHIYVYDLLLRQFSTIIPLDDIGISGEPEDVSVYDGHLYLFSAAGICYQIDFD